MKKLRLELSSVVKGRYEIDVEDINKSCFALNRSFIINTISCDNKIVNYKVIETRYNYKIISFDLLDESHKVIIEYEGIIDGSTGRYPYVIEKTTDDFYLLRGETVFYPTFEIPESEEYLAKMLYPTIKEKFQITIKIDNKYMLCTNLDKINQFIYEGYNPTFAVGNFKRYRGYFGEIYHMNLEENSIMKIDNIIKSTNEYMNRFKNEKIKDFKVIVIPQGYGSFVLSNTMFITSDGVSEYEQLIHELIHTNWNPLCDDAVQKSRFFDEAITQYFTARVCKALAIKPQEDIMTNYKNQYLKMIKDNGYEPHPIEEYHIYDCGDLSYTFGALALNAIENKIGTNNMDRIMSKMLDKYKREKINFAKFKTLFNEDIDDIYNDYFLTNNASNMLSLLI